MALEDVLRNFDKVVGEMKEESEKVVYKVSADLLRESNELTPFDRGWLRKSGKVKVEKKRNNVIGTVSYGDSRVDYAQKVHEIKAQNYSEPGTSWKYLERPLKANAKKYQRALKKANKGATR